MRINIQNLTFIVGLCGLTACTYNIKPAVPSITSPAGSGSLINCTAVLLMPDEFVSREYVSSFDAREIRFMIGSPAAQAVEALVRSRFSQVDKSSATGDGTLEFVRLASKQNADALLLVRPRFTRLESSVVPFRYNVEFGLALDISGLSSPFTAAGLGIGTAYVYLEPEIQKAADAALAQAITSLGSALPTSCQ